MELEVKRTIYVDLDDIIGGYGLDKNSTDKEIYEVVGDNVCTWDDCEYYLIADEELRAICTAIAEKLRSEPTAEDWEDFWRED